MEVIQDLMNQQKIFESTIVGNDGNLSNLNTPEYSITRGVIGEAEEALESLADGDWEHAQEELIDVLIFLCTAFNHMELSYATICELASQKMDLNRIKYYSDPERDKGLTVAEIMAKRKREWNEIVIYESEPLGE